VISQYPHNEIELANGIGSLPGKKNRWKLADKMRMQGYSFATIVHPSSIIAPDVFLEEGVQVMAGVVIQSIGKNSIIAASSVVYRDVPDGMVLIQKKQQKLTIQGSKS
jgi:UDP-3-O-[3-hydroxymyristoyl] glucosamine N-acyltransferase